MTRDELILYFEPFIKSIVKKFNDDILDDDLVSEGMYSVIKVVDRHISENGSMNPDDIKARVYVWSRNNILDYKNKASNRVYNYNDIDIESLSNDTDIIPIINKKWFDDKTLSVYELLLETYSADDICRILNISKRTYERRKSEIKNILTVKLGLDRTIL